MYSGTCLMWSPVGPHVQWNLGISPWQPFQQVFILLFVAALEQVSPKTQQCCDIINPSPLTITKTISHHQNNEANPNPNPMFLHNCSPQLNIIHCYVYTNPYTYTCIHTYVHVCMHVIPHVWMWWFEVTSAMLFTVYIL